MNKDTSYLIVGAGIFGISAAYGLASAGYTNVTVIDRCSELPAPDAASTDINKVIRSEYADIDYHKLAAEAIQEFKTPKWEGVYHNVGIFSFAKPTNAYAQEIRKNAEDSSEHTTEVFDSIQEAQNSELWKDRLPHFPPGLTALANTEGGWAASGACVARMMQWFVELGGKVVPGQEFSDFIYTEGDVLAGVLTKGGREFRADQILLAAGAWTEKMLEHTRLSLPRGLLQASGQCIAAVQLDKELVQKHRNNPVLMNLENCYYMFPPTHQGVVKFVFHAPGYLNIPKDSQVSVPRTALSAGGQDGAIPLKDQTELKNQLREFYPDLAALPMAFTRVCWYTDTADGNFLIAVHPRFKNCTFVTGGSGHGFKFAPVLPKYILQRLEGRLDPHLVNKWAFTRESTSVGDGPRAKSVKADFRTASWEKQQDWEMFDKSLI